MPEEIDDQKTLVREVSFEVGGDGRTLEALIVPYNKVARVSDPPNFEPYEERWLPGAFAKQTNAPDRVKVWLTFEHEEGIRGIVGHGVKLVEREDGLYGTFRVHSNADGDKALQLINDGITQGLSLEAVPLRTRINAGVVERVKGTLKKVGLTWKPAFQEAAILAVREQREDEEPEDDEKPDETASNEPEGDEPAPEPAPEAPAPESSLAVARALASVGYEKVLVRESTNEQWDANQDRFSDDEYEQSALIVREGEGPVKARCSMPVFEPTGELNVNALAVAARSIHSANLTLEEKSAVARKIVRLYRQTDLNPPSRLLSLAASR